MCKTIFFHLLKIGKETGFQGNEKKVIYVLVDKLKQLSHECALDMRW